MTAKKGNTKIEWSELERNEDNIEEKRIREFVKRVGNPAFIACGGVPCQEIMDNLRKEPKDEHN